MVSDTVPLPGYREPYGLLLATLQKQSGGWRHQIGVPTPEEIVWQAYPGGHSIGMLMLHLAEVETYWIETVACGREMTPAELALYHCADTDPFTGKWATPPREPAAYYFEILDSVRARTLERVKEFGDPETVKQAEWGPITLRAILTHLIWHDSYHGGQMALLQKLASVVPPS